MYSYKMNADFCYEKKRIVVFLTSDSERWDEIELNDWN